ncbi:MAG: hypothetical protein K2N37_05425 [Lachnospiraceae bacterium]|nr:hypothetical protein [Lachnospiraceae bacterium]
MEERIEERLEKAAARIVPDRAVQERILEGVKAKKVSRKRLSVRVPAAVLAACMLVCLLWFGGTQSLLGEEIVVYAASEENGWQKLKEGERILLKKEPYEIIWRDEDIEDFDEYGQSYYYPYKCTFRVEVPDNYRYSQQGVFIRDDHIWAGEGSKDVIEWWVAPERPEDAGRVMQGSLRIWIVNDKLEQVGAYDLKLTKEDGKCYAELIHVWGKWGK